MYWRLEQKLPSQSLINKWELHLGAKILIIGSNALPLNKLPYPFSKTAVFCPTSSLTCTVFVCLFPLGIQVNRDNSLYQGCGEPGPLTGFIQKIATIFQGFFKDFSRTTLDFQGQPTRNIISQIVQKMHIPSIF